MGFLFLVLYPLLPSFLPPALLPQTLTITHTHSLHTHTHTHHSHISLRLTHTHSHTHTHISLTHLTHTHSHTHSLILTHTHTHTHSSHIHTLAQNCLIEFCCGMHLTCKNNPNKPDRSGPMARPEKLRHVPTEQIAKTVQALK